MKLTFHRIQAVSMVLAAIALYVPFLEKDTMILFAALVLLGNAVAEFI